MQTQGHVGQIWVRKRAALQLVHVVAEPKQVLHVESQAAHNSTVGLV